MGINPDSLNFIIWILYIVVLLPICAISDIRTRRVRTWQIITGLALLILYICTSQSFLPALVSGILCFLILITIYFFAGGPGGGDIKIISITACFTRFFPTLYGLLAGCILAVIYYFLHKSFQHEPATTKSLNKDSSPGNSVSPKIPLLPFFSIGLFLVLL